MVFLLKQGAKTLSVTDTSRGTKQVMYGSSLLVCVCKLVHIEHKKV